MDNEEREVIYSAPEYMYEASDRNQTGDILYDRLSRLRYYYGNGPRETYKRKKIAHCEGGEF